MIVLYAYGNRVFLPRVFYENADIMFTEIYRIQEVFYLYTRKTKISGEKNNDDIS